jgi:hypothetical protein
MAVCGSCLICGYKSVQHRTRHRDGGGRDQSEAQMNEEAAGSARRNQLSGDGTMDRRPRARSDAPGAFRFTAWAAREDPANPQPVALLRK